MVGFGCVLVEVCGFWFCLLFGFVVGFACWLRVVVVGCVFCVVFVLCWLFCCLVLFILWFLYVITSCWVLGGLVV